MYNADWIKRNNCRDLLDGNLNRMSVTDDFDELKKMCFYALRRVNEYYELNRKRLLSKED